MAVVAYKISSQSTHQHGQGQTQKPSPDSGAVDGQWLLREGEAVFFKGMHHSRLAITQWMPPQPEVHKQHEADLVENK